MHDVLPGLQLPRVHPVPQRAPRCHPLPPSTTLFSVGVALLFPVRTVASELAEAEALLLADNVEVGLRLGGVHGGRGGGRSGAGVAAADERAEAVVELGDVVGGDGGRGRRGGGRGREAEAAKGEAQAEGEN